MGKKEVEKKEEKEEEPEPAEKEAPKKGTPQGGIGRREGSQGSPTNKEGEEKGLCGRRSGVRQKENPGLCGLVVICSSLVCSEFADVHFRAILGSNDLSNSLIKRQHVPMRPYEEATRVMD